MLLDTQSSLLLWLFVSFCTSSNNNKNIEIKLNRENNDQLSWILYSRVSILFLRLFSSVFERWKLLQDWSLGFSVLFRSIVSLSLRPFKLQYLTTVLFGGGHFFFSLAIFSCRQRVNLFILFRTDKHELKKKQKKDHYQRRVQTHERNKEK